MNEQISTFLQYDYAETRNLASTLITTAGGTLAGSLLFAQQFGVFPQRNRWRSPAAFGIYALGASALFSGSILLTNHAAMLGITHELRRARVNLGGLSKSFDQHASLTMPLFVAAGVSLLIGGFLIFYSAFARRKRDR